MNDIEYAIKLTGISKEDKVLEIASGHNIHPGVIFSNFCKVFYATNKDNDKIRIYNEWLNDRGRSFYPSGYKLGKGKIKQIGVNAENLPFKNNYLDLILFHHAWNFLSAHNTNLRKVLESTHNALKMRGCAIAIEYFEKDIGEREEMFEGIGFSVNVEGNIIIGRKVLERPNDLSGKDKYLSSIERIEKVYRETIEAIRSYSEQITL